MTTKYDTLLDYYETQIEAAKQAGDHVKLASLIAEQSHLVYGYDDTEALASVWSWYYDQIGTGARSNWQLMCTIN